MVALDDGVRPSLMELKDVFDTDPDKGGLNDDALRAYLNAAHEVVEDTADSTNESIASSKLEKMEKYLAAHFASAQDPRVESYRVADARRKYQRTEDSTDYWQIVVALDPTGMIAGATEGRADFQTFGPGR